MYFLVGDIGMKRLSNYLLCIILIGLSFLCLISCSTPLNNSSDLDTFIEVKMNYLKIPGLSACIIKNNEVVWTKGYGWANIENKVPVTSDTVFMLASTSKTITGAAVMQLYEQNLLELDDDINDYLPFEVHIPGHPKVSITFRMLLTHTSSIKDNVDIMGTLYTEGDSPISLNEVLIEYLTPSGKWYDKGNNFYNNKPGTEQYYSNIGTALLGYLVEVISDTPFNQYCNENIFKPLGMNETSWFLSGLDIMNIAMPYNTNHKPYGHYGYADYPDGQLRTSVIQFAYFLIAIMNDGEFNGVRILKSETVETMLTKQFRDIAFIWWHNRKYNQATIGHDGADAGVRTSMFFLPDENIGIIVFTNGDFDYTGKSWTEWNNLLKRLYEESQNY